MAKSKNLKAPITMRQISYNQITYETTSSTTSDFVAHLCSEVSSVPFTYNQIYDQIS